MVVKVLVHDFIIVVFSSVMEVRWAFAKKMGRWSQQAHENEVTRK